MTSNMFHHKYKDKSFSGGKRKQVSLRNESPCKTSFSVKRVCKTESPILQIPIFIENPTYPFFANFQRPHPPLNKREDFPAMRDVLRVLILC